MELDRDLASVQEVRDLVRQARRAQETLAGMDQREVDRLVEAMARAAEQAAAPLAKMAVSETGFGVEKDKITKNLFAARRVYASIKDAKTIGVINEIPEKRIWEAAVPMGVVAGLVPSTNPTSTAIFKALIAIKAGNALIISPHPAAIKCIGETVRVLNEAIRKEGGPEGLIGMMTLPTLVGTAELMKLSNMILATGGSAMVKAAYSSGTPALGVGPGNVPAFIERTCDIPSAVRRIMASKTFDNGTVCASEQAIVTETCIRDQVVAEFKKQGGYFVSGEEEKKLAAVIMRQGSDTVNPRIVGRSALDIAGMAGIQVPQTTRVLLCHQEHVGREYPFSIEKLSPILAFYTEPDWQKACERCMELIRFAGLGHSCAIHTENPELVRAFLLKKPVSRLLINTGSTQGGIGASTGIMPSLTLGCGAVGGSATSDNVTVHHLYQVRRAAWGLIEPEDTEGGRASAPAPAYAPEHRGESLSEAQREQIVEAVLRQIRQGSSWSNT